MSIVAGILKSSLGKKYIMAGTGVFLILFVVGHLVGNLQVFGPPELINNYAHFLQSKPVLVWSARLGLLVIVGLHIATAVQLSVANKEARPVGYADGKIYGASWASRYMLVSGLVIAAFIVYHIAHFTALIPGISGATDFRKLRNRAAGVSGHSHPGRRHQHRKEAHEGEPECGCSGRDHRPGNAHRRLERAVVQPEDQEGRSRRHSRFGQGEKDQDLQVQWRSCGHLER
jgi:hypothetical protein